MLANEQMQEIRARVMPDGAPPEGPERDALMTEYRAETAKLAGDWRHESLKEWRALLEAKLG